MAEQTKLERLIRAPRRRVSMSPRVNELEGATKGLAKAHRIVPHYGKAAASFRSIERKGGNDCVPSDFQGSLKARDIRSAVTPNETKKLALQAYVNKLVIKGERNQDQLMVKAFQYLKKRQEKIVRGKTPHVA